MIPPVMLMIRYSRTGKLKQPYYRIVVQERSRDPWSPAIEVIGNVDPRAERSAATLNRERILYWLSKGATPSATVHNLLVDAGLLTAKKVRSSRMSKKRAAALAAATPAAA